MIGTDRRWANNAKLYTAELRTYTSRQQVDQLRELAYRPYAIIRQELLRGHLKGLLVLGDDRCRRAEHQQRWDWGGWRDWHILAPLRR
jgi:hypothetical protein